MKKDAKCVLIRWNIPCYSAHMLNKRVDNMKQFTAAFRREDFAHSDVLAQKLGIMRTLSSCVGLPLRLSVAEVK